MIDIGHGHHMDSRRVALILRSSDSSTKEIREMALKKGALYDVTSGYKEKSVVVLATNQVVLSSIKPKVLRKRMEPEYVTI